MDSMPTFSMEVVGCKVNQVEAAMLKAQFENLGFKHVEDKQAASLMLLHTCTVTHKADRDCRRFIEQATRLYPEARLVLTGCYAALEKDRLMQHPRVLAVIGQQDRYRAGYLVRQQLAKAGQVLPDAADMLQPYEDSGFFNGTVEDTYRHRARAVIKIQDGCDGACTYCRVRLARGPSRSRPVKDVIEEIKRWLSQGYQELVLTGVNLAAYQPGLEMVLDRINELPGTFRIRLSSLEPQYLTGDLMERLLIYQSWCCPHLHVPIQSGADRMLKAMNRPLTNANLRKKLLALKTNWSGLTLTADMIVGFPGESDDDFNESMTLARQLGLAKIHVFPFSSRPDTGAAAMPHQVASRVITQRAKAMRQLSHELSARHQAAMVGRPAMVLLEHQEKDGYWSGTTGEYDRAMVETKGRPGQLTAVFIKAVHQQVLMAQAL